MRKKIFIIHGKGMIDGIGMEGGGDLDTVGSNAFYAAWARHAIFLKTGQKAVCGRDFAFDFVNYSEGLGHLVAHSGCDVYIPDFPIDALAPRMQFEAIEDPEVAILRNAIAAAGVRARVAVKVAAPSMEQPAKETFNDVMKRIANLRKLSDLPAIRAALGLTVGVLSALVPGFEAKDPPKEKPDFADSEIPLRETSPALSLDDIIGPGFAESRADLSYLADRIESFLAEKINPTEPAEKVLAENLTKPLRRATFMIRKAENLHGLLLEAVVIPSALDGLSPLLGGDGNSSAGDAALLRESVIKSLARAGLNLSPAGSGAAARQNGWGLFHVSLTEEASGRPVAGVRVTFVSVRETGIILESPARAGIGGIVEVETDKNGVAAVGWRRHGEAGASTGSVTAGSDGTQAGTAAIAVATFDEINYVPLPVGAKPPADPGALLAAARPVSLVRTIGGDATGSNPINADDMTTTNPIPTAGGAKSGSVSPEETGFFPDEAEEDVVIPRLGGEGDGEAPSTDRATSLSVKIIEDDIRQLAASDVRIVRMDDHHPWTPAIHSMLSGLAREGLIGTFVIHAFERGKEMPKDEAKCGADLIHEAMLEGTPADNTGLRELKRLAHVQDLHIIEDPMSIDLSKLIGSGFPKVEMALGLSKIGSMEAMQGIMEARGWKERVSHYESGLDEVLPRLFRTMAHVTLEVPAGWNAEGGSNDSSDEPTRIKVLMILAPFTDRKAGEAKINVASAINFLRDKVAMDFLFYCYGSMLMTTRKVSEAHSPIDLSLLSQHVGTRADGGHAEAATCKPGSNPGFPKNLFTKLDDWNFLEYANYIGTRAAERFGLRLVSVDPVRAPFYEEGMERLLPRLLTGVFQMRLTVAKPGEPSGEAMVVAAMTPRALAADGETQPTIGAALKCLDESGYLHGASLFAYCRGGSKVSFRRLNRAEATGQGGPTKNAAGENSSLPGKKTAGTASESAPPLAIDLSALSEAMGNPKEAASPFSLCIKPSLSPGYRENIFPTMGPELFPEYLEFLGAGFSRIGGCRVRSIEPSRPPDSVMRSAEVGKLVDWCTKRMATINILRAPSGGDWEGGIKNPWRLLLPLARVLPIGAARRFALWLYGLSGGNRSTVVVLPQPPSRGGRAEATVPLLVWRLKEELDFGYLFLASGSRTLVIIRTDPEDSGIHLEDFAEFIDGDGKPRSKLANRFETGAKRDMAVVFPEGTSMLPVELKHLQEVNFGRYLDWLAAVMQSSGGCVVKSIERWRKS